MILKLVEILATVTDAIFMMWFIPRFFNTSIKKGNKPWNYLLPATLLLFQLVADRFLYGFALVSVVIVFTITFLFTASICGWKNYGFATVLAACLHVSVGMISGSAVYSVFSLFIDDIDVIMQGAAENERVIYVLVSVTLRFILYKLILLLFKSNNSLDKKNGLFVVTCFSLMAIGLGILMYMSVNTPNISPSLVLALILIITVSNVSLYALIYQLQKYRKKEYEYRLIQERMTFAQISSDQATKIWDNIRKVRHEMKNHLTVAIGKINRGDVKGCHNYLSELIGNVEHFGDIVKTDNAVIDYLINSKLTGLDEVKVIVSGYVGNFDDISDADLACLLGNIIDNAVEAESKVEDKSKRQIELHFLLQNQNRIIVCKNTIEKSVLETNSELHTTKKDPISHGLGHQIVAEIAEKYYGFVNYSEVDDMFCVQIILPKTV